MMQLDADSLIWQCVWILLVRGQADCSPLSFRSWTDRVGGALSNEAPLLQANDWDRSVLMGSFRRAFHVRKKNRTVPFLVFGMPG